MLMFNWFEYKLTFSKFPDVRVHRQKAPFEYSYTALYKSSFIIIIIIIKQIVGGGSKYLIIRDNINYSD